MKISQKAEYALRAMLELALRIENSQATRNADIARQQHIPEKFLELILVELRRAGLIKSQRGPEGGHRLARPPREISVGDIWRAIDGSSRENSILDTSGRHSDPFKSVWEEVDKAIAGVVNKVSLADMLKRAETRRGVADYNI